MRYHYELKTTNENLNGLDIAFSETDRILADKRARAIAEQFQGTAEFKSEAPERAK